MTTSILRAWSCTVRLVVGEQRHLSAATNDLSDLMERVDRAASRFRADSELTRVNERAGRPTPVSRLMVELTAAALKAAAQTGGAVDPTLGRSLCALGYDRDIALGLDTDDPAVAVRGGAWRGVKLHRGVGMLSVPAGSELDLGATAKAYTADLAARQISQRYGTDVLVEIGGDLAVVGNRRWAIRVAEREGGDGQTVVLHSGGMATSTTTIRRWRRDGSEQHHIIDPATGAPADGPWRTVTVSAPSAFAANVASTATIVLGERAIGWLERQGRAARLVAADGSITTTAGWPAPVVAVAAA